MSEWANVIKKVEEMVALVDIQTSLLNSKFGS